MLSLWTIAKLLCVAEEKKWRPPFFLAPIDFHPLCILDSSVTEAAFQSTSSLNPYSIEGEQYLEKRCPVRVQLESHVLNLRPLISTYHNSYQAIQLSPNAF